MIAWFRTTGALFVMHLCVALLASAGQFRTREGFSVELVYAVPRDSQGSWVSLAVDQRGRLITSDQAGGLYRVTMTPNEPPFVEHIDVPVGHAHGLLWAFDSLYAMVAENKYEGPGLYRIRDRDGDDRFDDVKLLRRLEGTGEHGPHSIVLAPDGKSLYVSAGNKTRLPDGPLLSRVPRHWGEDDLLPRIWGPAGSEAGTPAPGGWIARVGPAGESWEIFAVGFRNPFDAAFNRDGELFTADADAEFDLGTSWYQPTRVFHVVSGTDYGWRSGTGKWPPYYADTLPPTVELGPGSPTGITFGYGTKFPTRYQNALFVGDWSYGRVFAVHLQAQGSSYAGQTEEFLSGTPLPITDLVVNPHDGAMYFTLGGRGTESGLYRLRFTGPAAASPVAEHESMAAVRQRLELWHLAESPPEAIDVAWSLLDHQDRFVRNAARLVLEHASPVRWQARVFQEPSDVKRMHGILALSRSGEKTLLAKMLQALDQIRWEQLDRDQCLTILRAYEVTLLRMTSRESIDFEPERYMETLPRLEAIFPSNEPLIDAALCKLLVYLNSTHVTNVAVDQLTHAASREEQLRFALPLRHQKLGWTDPLRQEYFQWLQRAANWPGGVSMSKYTETIGRDALTTIPAVDQPKYAAMLTPNQSVIAATENARPFVRKWDSASVLSITTGDLSRRDPKRGRRLFGEAKCFDCHRIAGDGGALGPDLTTVAKRFSRADLVDAIVTPNKVINDQFAATTVVTDDGRTIVGRLVNILREQIMIQTDMLQPAKLVAVPQSEIADMRPSDISLMPSGLLDSFRDEEIADLIAFLLADR